MANFVIVHGGFGGGWEWTEVATLLRSHGHAAFTPTLTGMGERSHLGPVGLATHVEDVVSVIQYENLSDVVLCGASYGGMAITGAAERVSGSIQLLIYIDALVPQDGHCGLDLLPKWFTDMVRASKDEGEWVPVPEVILPPAGMIPEEKRRDYIARLGPQPAATFTEPLNLTGEVESLHRAFVRCTGATIDSGSDPIGPMAARAKAEGWHYRELETPHDPHLFDPVGTASVIEELASLR